MKLDKLINLTDAGEVSQQLKNEKVSKARFSVEVPEETAVNLIKGAMQAVVEYRGGSFLFDADTENHVRQIARWLIDPNGTPGLMLCGLYGNGKTTLAKALAWLIGYITEREYGYSRRANVRFYTAKDICRLCAASEKFKEQYDQYDDIFREPMIIIDELGEEPREVMVYGMIHTPLIDLIGERYAQQRMTIITTNLDVDELKAKYGERIYDRFTEMITSVIFENDSYRPNR
ncbi:MAG: ATP-binding protein [Muribaculaceae bacterium]|nr:ATP-binding protein [Muribaculaceae bacterium]